MNDGALSEKRVIVTRPEGITGPLCTAIRKAGATAVHLPMIRVEPVLFAPPGPAKIRESDIIVFTSANGVRFLLDGLGRPSLDALIEHPYLAAVGPGTAAALRLLGCKVRHVASEHVAESFARDLANVRGRRVLWVRGDRARRVLSAGLESRGAKVRELVVYRTVAAAPSDAETIIRGADAVTFTSPSGVEAWVGMLGIPLMPVVCIGPITAREAARHDVPVAAVASPHTLPGLVAALRGYLGSRKTVEA